jgi:hypothetical protein
LKSTKGVFPGIQPIEMILAVYLFIYISLGINTEIHYIEKHPLPTSFLADYNVYKKSVKTALTGQNPYEQDFRYFPPALLVAEFFYHIPNPNEFLQGSIYLTTNLLLLFIIIYGLANYFNYKLSDVWYWIPLAFFSGPVLEGLHVGQINIITEFGILLVLAAGSALPVLAGLGLSLAIVTKITPAVFLLYFLSTKNLKAIFATLVSVLVLVILTGLRYGFNLYPMFISTFGNMLQNFHDSLNSQSLFSKLITNGLLPEGIAVHPQEFQNILSAYVGIVILLSTILGFVNKQKEPQFIVMGLASMLVPNWMWYHHYIFFIVPILAWIAWSRQNLYVLTWSLLGFLIIQLDRWYLTTGLLIHIFGHISIMVILVDQFQKSISTKSIAFMNRNLPTAEGN